MKQYDDPRIPAVYGEAELKRMIDEIKASQDALREDRQRLLEENKKLEYQVGRLKEDNAKLTEVVAGYEELQNNLLSILEGIIAEKKPTKDEPYMLSQETINKLIENGSRAAVDFDAETQMWKLYLKEQGEE